MKNKTKQNKQKKCQECIGKQNVGFFAVNLPHQTVM